MMMGVWVIFRISRQAEKPSSSGIMMSMMIRSKVSDRQRRTASMPSPASVTVCPSNSAYLRIRERIRVSSSTTRIWYMVVRLSVRLFRPCKAEGAR